MIKILRTVTIDGLDGRPWPPPESNVLWAAVRQANGRTLWRALQIAQSDRRHGLCNSAEAATATKGAVLERYTRIPPHTYRALGADVLRPAILATNKASHSSAENDQFCMRTSPTSQSWRMNMAQDFDTEDFFKSNFFKATEHLGEEGAELVVTIKSIDGEIIGREKELRPVLRFTDANVKPLVLNKTNWSTIRRALGPPKNWPDVQIVLVAKSVEFGGEPTLGTRVKVPQKKPTTSVADDPNDEIPF